MTTATTQKGPLKCYVAGSVYPSEYTHVEACIAHDSREARTLIWAKGSQIREECDYRIVDMRVRRETAVSHDWICQHYTGPDILKSEHKRAIGWFCDGDAQCSSCHLYEFDGDHPVCEECEQCDECGHAEGCSQAEESQA